MKKRLQNVWCLFIFTMVLTVTSICVKPMAKEVAHDVFYADTSDYTGIRNKTLNEKTADIIDADWKNMETEELDRMLGESEYKYVGLFLSQLSDKEMTLLCEKSDIVHTTVGRVDMTYNSILEMYVANNQTEADFIDYCLEQFEKERGSLLSPSDWICKTPEGVFYISSPDRQKIYKYVVTGIYGHTWCDSMWGTPYTDSTLSITYSTVKNGASSITFPCPIPTSITTYIASVRATRTDLYRADGTFINTAYNWGAIDQMCDDGAANYGIAINFNNYYNTRTGYHCNINSINVYNAGAGVGTTTEEALAYNYSEEYLYGRDPLRREKDMFAFTKTEMGYINYYYNGVYKSGYNWSNATDLNCLSSYTRGTKPNIHYLNGVSGIDDANHTLTLNVVTTPLAFGMKWYDYYGNLAADSNIPELNFNLAPNTYNVIFNGNGATSGSTPSQAMIYDVGYRLNANGFVRTGYIFAGWSASPNGPVEYYNEHYVSNMSETNGGKVILYAQWKSLEHTLTLDYNGGTYNGKTLSSYPVTYGTGNYCNISWGRPTRTGYTFNGFWTTADGGTQVYNVDGLWINDNIHWKDGVWCKDGDVTLYAHWTPITYTVAFDGNGATSGSMASASFTYDVPQNLPDNCFTKNNGYGESVFFGWNIDSDTQEVLYRDGAEVLNLTETEYSTVTLYAVWDDCPWITVEDLYYTLDEARSGFITYDELMSRASAKDREAGGIVQPGIDEEKGTTFTIIDYDETDFTQFEHEGSVTETYRVIDSSGNEYKKMITVHIVDTMPVYIEPKGTTRFISEKYYYETYENGGLEENSIWKTEPEYIQAIERAFENSRNNTPIRSFYFTHEEILSMKELSW